MKRAALMLCTVLLSFNVAALSLSDLTQQDTATGLKDALSQGARVAVRELGQPGGFSDNPDVRIELPGKLGSAARTLKMMGMGSQITALENSMNQAAEAAVPQAETILVNAMRGVTHLAAKNDDADLSTLIETIESLAHGGQNSFVRARAIETLNELKRSAARQQ